jgi:hypothetical protein
MTTPETPDVDDLAARLQEALGENYEVERPLGAGGFAVVYLVRDLSLKWARSDPEFAPLMARVRNSLNALR